MMNVSEAFLVNTKNFKAIIEALVSYETDDLVITSSLLESLGYSDPNDLLVVRLLKEFRIINNDGTPGKYFVEFRNASSTKKALARGVIYANKDLFDQYPKIHEYSTEKSKEIYGEVFKGKKTDLIIKYISKTFQHVVNYCGSSTIDDILNGKEKPVEELEFAHANNNGASKTNNTNGRDTINSDIKNNSFNDLINGFDSKNNDNRDNTMALNKEENQTDEDVIESTPETLDTVQKDKEDPFSFEVEPDNDEEKTVATSTETEEAEEAEDFDKESEEENIVEKESSDTTQDKDSDTAETQSEGEPDFVRKALFRKSDLLHKLQRWEDLLPTLENIIERYDNDEHDDLVEPISRSVIRRAMILLKLNRTEEALPALNNVIVRFRNSGNQEFYDQASKAMLCKVQIIEKSDSPEVLPLYNTIINRVDSGSNVLSSEMLDQIYTKRFDLIITNGNKDEILDASIELISRFKTDKKNHDHLQKAMILRAEILDEMGRDEDAIEAYDAFLTIFGN